LHARKTLKEVEVMTKERLDEILRELGFERTKDCVYPYTPPYGEHFRIVYSINDYEVEIEENSKENHFSNEGAEKILEIRFSVEETEISYYVEVYRVIKFSLYIVHVFTGFEEEYFAVYVWDKQELETIAKLELDGGYVFVGSQEDLKTLLPKLIKKLNPFIITVY
jgi:signal recognition particle subunit SEC65